MHLSMATLFVLLAFKINKTIGFLAVLYLFVILVGSVYTGWHYAIDGYFSILATVAIWRAVAWRPQLAQRAALAPCPPT